MLDRKDGRAQAKEDVLIISLMCYTVGNRLSENGGEMEQNPMKPVILLTGATGSVGLETLRELLRRSDRYRVRVFSLDTPQERAILQPFEKRIEIVWGDLRSPENVRKAVDGVDAVLHVAAIIPPLADEKPQLAYDVNTGGTRNLLDAMQTQPTPPRIVYTSSISVYGDRVQAPWIRVGDPLNPSVGDEYARTKIAAEEMVQDSGLPWTIFRLSGILNPHLEMQPLMFHLPLDTALEWTHNSDTGLALVNALDHFDELDGRIFNLGGGEKCRVIARDFIRKTMEITGVNPDALPEYAFATQNFHSGYYADGDDLESILHFRRKTLADHYAKVAASIPSWRRAFNRLIPTSVTRRYLESLSEPLKALRENDTALIERFYGSQVPKID
jgi:nucleoside-diphosphate-sugar epimerase